MIAAVAVTDSPVQVLPPPATGTYQFVGLSNNGSQPVYVKFTPDSTAVTASNGIVVPPGAAVLVDQDDSPILQNGIYAVCAAGKSSTVAVQAY